jgi:DNA-binding Lrp family transcriptional regulator
MKAFVLGTVGTRSSLLDTLSGVRGDKNVEESYLIWGPYDIISKVRADSLPQLNSILDVMREHGVVDTNTLIVNEGGLSVEREGCGGDVSLPMFSSR